MIAVGEMQNKTPSSTKRLLGETCKTSSASEFTEFKKSYTLSYVVEWII